MDYQELGVLLEDACHQLGIVASHQLTSSGAGSTYNRYREALQSQSTLRDRITRTKTQISGFEQTLALTIVSLPSDNHSNPEITERKKRVEEMVWLILKSLDVTWHHRQQ